NRIFSGFEIAISRPAAVRIARSVTTSAPVRHLNGTARAGLRIVLHCRAYMASREHLGEFEQVVLLAALRLGSGTYGAAIRREIEARTRRAPTVGALYRTLDRLEAKGYVRSWLRGPQPQRGGRPKRDFAVRPL